jgi:hypothetical protein
MTETVPADIAAAIDLYAECARRSGEWFGVSVDEGQAAARATLDAAILAHLRKADEMKAALERIEAGT